MKNQNRIVSKSLLGVLLGIQMISFTAAMDQTPQVNLGRISVQNTLASGRNFTIIATNNETNESHEFNVPALRNGSEDFELPYGNYSFDVKGVIKLRSEFDMTRSGVFSLDGSEAHQFKNDPEGEVMSKCTFIEGGNTAVINDHNVETPLFISVINNEPDAFNEYNEIGCQLVQF